MINVGLIGFGYWGPNLARNIFQNPNCCLKRIVDLNEDRRKAAHAAYPGVDISGENEAVLKATDIDVVAIATPVFTHFSLAKMALEHGKHVLVEKPMTSTVGQAEQLIDLAQEKNLILMVDHTFLFTNAVRTIKQLADAGDLGDIFYYDSVRVNLGLFQRDINVIWDLAPHDLSIIDHVIQRPPIAVSATGQCHLNGKEDVGYLTLHFDNNFIAHCHVNWLSPVKVRKTLIGASKAMLAWDELTPDEPIKVYDRGVEMKPTDDIQGVYNLMAAYRMGPMYAPVIPPGEALKSEIAYLVECIEKGQTPFNDGESGARVVRILEASNQSLKHNGAAIEL
jgi:predicted dehydrogenase